jgi:prevent-host-death family protein
MDRAVSATEANQHFSEILREVAQGDSVTVTSRGKPVARILPVDQASRARSVRRLLKRLRSLPLRNVSWSRADLYE